MERMFDIANVPFEQVPEEEKKEFDSKPHETGSFQGYKLRQYWVRALTTMLQLRSLD